jgi:hypothetical protein
MIADVLAVYGEEVAPHKKTARNIAYCINNLLKWWGEKTISRISPPSRVGLMPMSGRRWRRWAI